MEIKSGILLTGGRGTRLSHFTNKVSNKHLYPVGDKLVVDYSLNTIIKMGVKDLTVILGGDYFDDIVSYLNDGSNWGLNITFVFQKEASGIAQAINLAKHTVKDDHFAVVLGDNCFQTPVKYNKDFEGAQIFLNNSPNINLHNFGVLSIFNNSIMSIEEKPQILATGMSNYAITGAYVFDQDYFNYFKDIKKSDRGEFEITEIIKRYKKANKLHYNIQPGYWSDLGTVESIRNIVELNEKEPIIF